MLLVSQLARTPLRLAPPIVHATLTRVSRRYGSPPGRVASRLPRKNITTKIKTPRTVADQRRVKNADVTNAPPKSLASLPFAKRGTRRDTAPQLPQQQHPVTVPCATHTSSHSETPMRADVSPDAADDEEEINDAFLDLLQSTSAGARGAASSSSPVGTSQVMVSAQMEQSEVAPISSLTTEQQHAVQLALDGVNIFVTGGAGTGKSAVIGEIVAQLRARRKNVYVTATTGVAALNIRGATLNSFAGVHFGSGTVDEIVKKVRRNRKASGRWVYCSALVIDEVSMLDAELFEKLDGVAQRLRKRPGVPFGGIQLIVCGDFLQLPPIDAAKGFTVNSHNNSSIQGGSARYAFESPLWQALDFATVCLRCKHRQGGDEDLQHLLDDVRVGSLGARSLSLLRGRAAAGSAAAEREQHLYSFARAKPLPQQQQQQQDAQIAGETAVADHNDDWARQTALEEAQAAVRVCGTNAEVDQRNALHFSVLAPRTDPRDPTRRLRADAEDVHVEGGVGDDEARLTLKIYTAQDSLAPERTPSPSSSAPSPSSGSDKPNKKTKTKKTGSSSTASAAVNTARYMVRFDDSNLPKTLALKVGARVMLLHNVSTSIGLVNGSVGEVTGFLHPLELLDLVLRAPRERHAPTPRGRALMERGGFASIDDAFRCTETSVASALSYNVRKRFPGIKSADTLSYADAFGAAHWEQLQAVTNSSNNGTTSVSGLDARLGPPQASSQPPETPRSRLARVEDDLAGLVAAAHEGTEVAAGGDGDGAGHVSERNGSPAAGLSASELFLGGLTPELLAAGRLPIVRFRLPRAVYQQQQQRQQQQREEEEQDEQVGGGRRRRHHRRPLPTHVFTMVSPHVQPWFMGTTLLATRTQLPLRHAWAITVHKSQGLTISNLQVDMQRFFSPGQAYVALSRATSLENLSVLSFSPRKVKTCERALAFYKAMPDGGGLTTPGQEEDMRVEVTQPKQAQRTKPSTVQRVRLAADTIESQEPEGDELNELLDELRGTF